MKNIKTSIKGNKLTIEIDLSKDFGPSKSKKTLIIASTEGNKAIDGFEDVRLGLNCYKKNPEAP